MAVLLDATLGGNAVDTAANNISATTTNAVAAGSVIVMAMCCGGAATLNTPSGGGLTWTIDKTALTGSGNFRFGFASAPAPSGLSVSNALQANFSASVSGRGISLVAFSGVDNASPLDTTSGPTDFGTLNWTTASTTILAGSVLLGFSINENTNATSSPTSPSVEDDERNAGAGTFSITVAHRIESSAGAYTVAGAWSAGPLGSTVAAAYKAGAATSLGTSYVTHRMPLGV